MARPWKRTLCLVLAALLLAALAPVRTSAVDTVIFTAANERLYPLNDETMPFWSGGALYVPHTSISDNSLGIQFNRNREKMTVALYQLRSGFIFNLSTGYAEARDGQSVYAPLIVRGDTVFFPLDVVCRFFNLEYSYTRVNYGFLLRIKNESVQLSDKQYIDAANSAMATRYAQYERAHTPSEDTAEQTPGNEQTPVNTQRTVYFAVESTDAEHTAQVLAQFPAGRVAILFSPQSLSGADALLRRLAAGGGAVALRIDASEGADAALRRIDEANRALWSAANVKTRLVLLDGASEETALAVSDAGYCPLRFTLDYRESSASVSRMSARILSAADANGGRCRVFLGTDDAAADVLPRLLSSLRAENCTSAQLNESVA